MKGFVKITEKNQGKNGEAVDEYSLNVLNISHFNKGENCETEIFFHNSKKGFFYFKAEETIDEGIKLIELAQ